MKPSRSLNLALCGAALALGYTGTAGFAQEPVAPTTQEIGLLFAQTADQGTFTRARGHGAFTHVLEFARSSFQVVWFSDRPSRTTGQIPIRGFAASWTGFGFAAHPPNAALTLLGAHRHEDTLILELGRPRLLERGRRVRYPARIVHEASGNLAHLESARDKQVPHRFGRASLFIDAATGAVIDGCVMIPYTTCPGAQLTEASLAGVYLMHAVLTGANLSGTNLAGGQLTGADLSGANLAGADLGQADVSYGDLSSTNLTAANLARADLQDTNLGRANLTDADLTGADVPRAVLLQASITLCRTTAPDGTIVNRDC